MFEIGWQPDILNRMREIDRPEPLVRAEKLPKVIQGGMGVAVSDWLLAGEVARQGELGVVSGIAIGIPLARRLQNGDLNSKRILEESFPDPSISEKIIRNYFVDGGIPAGQRYKSVPMLSYKREKPNEMAEDLNLAGAFVEVALAKEIADGNGPIGINLLTKLEEPTITALYGAMLADVDVVIMGAGIPIHIPNVLDNLANKEPASIPLTVIGAEPGNHQMLFDTENRYPNLLEQQINRPNFLAIVSVSSLANYLSRRDNPPNGFVIEHWTAGGHNAGPRGKSVAYDEQRGEPVYGPRDDADTDLLYELGLPYWMAGSFGGPEKLKQAKDEHARGVQIGSAFALTQESGMSHQMKLRIVKRIMSGQDIDVFTDPLASPTGYPFKVARIEGTLSDDEVYKSRDRICDLGYLREKYQKDDGSIGYRCPSEPLEDYLLKGGSIEATVGRMCLCNALSGAIEMPQIKKSGTTEPSVITLGNDVNRVVWDIMDYLGKSADATGEPKLYTVKDVLDYVRGTSK